MNTFFEKVINHLYKHQILWSFMAVFTISLFDAIYYFSSEGKLFYYDTDCYTRALRILDWIKDFQWAEKIFPYANVPDGFVLHFTRINDVIWVLLSLPFMLFEPLKDAVFHGGFLFSPFFLFLSLIAFFWGLKPYIIKYEKTPVAFALVFITTLLFCYKLVNIFDFFRPDHHAAMFCIFCFELAVLLRYLANPKENHWIAAGCVSGLGLWCSTAIEGMLITGIVLTVLYINWLYGIIKSRQLILFNLGLFICVTLAWLINPPYGGYQISDVNRLSVIHVTLSALIFLSTLCLLKADKFSIIVKLVCLSGCASIILLLTFILFGANTLLTPVFSKELQQIVSPYISEMQPVYKTALAYCYIINLILGTGLVCYLLYQNKSRKIYALNMILLTVLTIPLGIAAVRFYPYYLAVFLYLNSFIIFSWMFLSTDKKYAYAIFIYLTTNIFLLTSFQSVAHSQTIPPISEKIENLATDYNISPQFCWDLGIKTLASPYHYNVRGLIDNHKLFFSSDEDEIKEILQQHQIKYIYLPQTDLNDTGKSFRNDYYIEPEKNIDKFYGKIMTGKDIYDWLDVVPSDFKNGIIYKVRYELF